MTGPDSAGFLGHLSSGGLDILSSGGAVVAASALRDQLLRLDSGTGGPRGLEIRDTRIAGDLDLADMTLPAPLHLIDCELAGSLCLEEARLPRLVLLGSRLGGIRADGVHVEKGIKAEDLTCKGQIRLIGASVDGRLDLSGAAVTGGGDCAVLADGLRVAGDLLMRKGSSAKPFTAHGGTGAVRLTAAQIGGNLDCEHAELTSGSGPALDAERLRTEGGVILRSAVVRGGVHLQGASVGGQLSCRGTTLDRLVADGLQADGDVLLSGLCLEAGMPRRREAAISLIGARVGGNLVCDEGAIRGSHGGTALDLRLAAVGKALSMSREFLGSAGGRNILLDGLTYPGIPYGMDRDEWLTFLRDRMRGYAAQPYQQLATVYRSAGRDDDARALLIALHEHRRKDPAISRRGRLRLLLLKLTVGYGYRPWRALGWLLATFLAASVFVVSTARLSDAIHRPVTGTPATRPRACSLVDQIGLAFDMSVPLVNTQARERCDVDARSAGEEWITVVGWIFRILGWGLATLFVAGYTGLIRKT